MAFLLNIQGKKLRVVDTMLFNGGLVRMVFGKSYDDEMEIAFYTDCPEGAEELSKFLIAWKNKWHKETPVNSTARPSVDDDISF